MIKNVRRNGYLSLCYHYIRPEKKLNLFPKILGNKIDEFHKHIRLLKKNYSIISPDDAWRFSYTDFSLNSKNGLLFTFDDGLSDHYKAAQILADYNIKAFFFIPTCVLMDKLPANPTIIHYCVAAHGLDEFLNTYRNALEKYKINFGEYDIKTGCPKEKIPIIKSIFKYKLKHKISRKILLYIYKNLFFKSHPNALEIMHLNREQVNNILKMGHSIGVHSHSHISIAANNLTTREFQKEVVEPKKYLEKTFNTSVIALSYPFGRKRDCLSPEELTKRTNEYQLAFTVEPVLNTKNTSPFNLGRYIPTSADNEIKLKKILKEISNGIYKK